METEDLIKLPASSNSEHGSENGDACESGSEAINSESLPSNSEVIEEIHGEAPGAIAGVLDENTDALMEDDFEKGPNCNSATAPIGFEMTNSASDVGKAVPVSSVHAENGFLSIQSEISFSNLKKNETLSSKREIDANSLSGVKRPRMAVDEQQPSVHVIYSSLPRESKQKLEKLLEQWSQWHAHWSSSSDLFPHVNDKADVPLFNSGHKCVAGIWRRDLLPSDSKKQEVTVKPAEMQETDQFVDYKDRASFLKEADSLGGIEDAAAGLIIRKRKQVGESKVSDAGDSETTTASHFKAEDAVALLLRHSKGYHAADEEDGPVSEDVAEKQEKKGGKKQKRVLGPERPSFLEEPDYSAWVPPEGQSGDGRTSLNDRLGY